MAAGFDAVVRRLPVISAIIGLGLTGTMALSTLPGPASPVCGPTCQDARFSRAMTQESALSRENARRARSAVEAKLAYSPFDSGAWLRLAVLEAGGYARPLNAAARQALENSYRFAPVDVAFTRWRLLYAFNHWNELSPGLRQSAAAEGRLLVQAGDAAIKSVGADITDPTGALAFRFLVMTAAPGRDP